MTGKGSTSARGYGWDHQQRRTRALAALAGGEPCWRCGRPMYHWQALDLDHVVALALGGGGGDRLAHAACNRRAGAVLGGQLRARRAPRRAAQPARYTRW